MFSLPVLIQKFAFQVLFIKFKSLKVSYSFYFRQRWPLRDDLRDVQLWFHNITRRPIKWDDVLITHIIWKSVFRELFFQCKSLKVSKSFYVWQIWSLRWDDVFFQYITRRPIKWDDVPTTHINSKICISGSFLSIQESKSFVFILFFSGDDL